MASGDYTERVVAALQRADDLCRALLRRDDESPSLNPDTRRRLVELADECELLAAIPLSELFRKR